MKKNKKIYIEEDNWLQSNEEEVYKRVKVREEEEEERDGDKREGKRGGVKIRE